MIILDYRPEKIGDDEVRFITPEKKRQPDVTPEKEEQPDVTLHNDNKGFNWSKWLIVALVIVVVIALAVAITLTVATDDNDELDEVLFTETQETAMAEDSTPVPVVVGVPYTSLTDTVVGQSRLTILTPRNATAQLTIGDNILDSQYPVLIAQAADVRSDNKEIVSAYVLSGNLVSRGTSKLGYCAIVNNEITIGSAEATPLFEAAINENGYFFRQYPLVYDGEIVENSSQRVSLRKALATLSGEVVVILGHEQQSFHDFSQALVDLGVTNAIYLVGSKTYLKARLEDGRIYEFGKRAPHPYPNTNFIFWQ